jgi:hypothetical protein
MRNETIETKTARIRLVNGIIHYQVVPEAEVTIEDTREYVEIQAKLTGGKKIPNLTDLRDVKSITREARAYLSGEEAVSLTSACALIIGSPVSKIIGNFFLGLNKPAYPTRLFISEENAFEWLKGFIEK